MPPTEGAVPDEVEQGAGGARLVGDRRDDDRGELEPHLGERLGEVGDGDPVVPDVDPHGRSAVLEVVEHRVPGHRRVGVVVQLAHVPRQRRVAHRAAAGERHPAGDAEGAVLPEVQGVDLEPTLEVAAQGGLGGRAVEPGVVGAALVEDGGDEPLPVLTTEGGKPAARAMVSAAAGGSVIVVLPRRPAAVPARPPVLHPVAPGGRRAGSRGGRPRPAPPP